MMSMPLSLLLLGVFVPAGEVVFHLFGILGSGLRWMLLLARGWNFSRAARQTWSFAQHLPLTLATVLSGVSWKIATVAIAGLLLVRFFLGTGNFSDSDMEIRWKRECALPRSAAWTRSFFTAMLISLRSRRESSGIWSPWAVVVLILLLHPGESPHWLWAASLFGAWSFASALMTRLRWRGWRCHAPVFLGVMLLWAVALWSFHFAWFSTALAGMGATLSLLLRMSLDIGSRGAGASARVFDPARISSGQFVQQMGFSGTEKTRPWVRSLIRLRTLSIVLTPDRAHLLFWRADLLAAVVVTCIRAV